MSLNNPLVAIIIPSYNHQDYIEYTIESAINQTYKNLELIIVDDCSTDNTRAVIEKYIPMCKERFANVEIFFKDENKGVVDSLNRAIDMAKAEFVYLTASDDIIKPHAVEKIISFMYQHPEYVLVGGDDELIDNNNKRIYWDENRNPIYDKESAVYTTFGECLRKQRQDVDFLSDDYGSYRSLIIDNYIPNGFIIKKNAILEVGKYKKDVLEDWYMNLQLAKNNYKFKFLDEVLYSYRWHNTNSVKKLSVTSNKYLIVCELERDYCYKNGYKKMWDNRYATKKETSIPKKIKREIHRILKKIFKVTNL